MEYNPKKSLQRAVRDNDAEGARPERPRVRQPARPDSGAHRRHSRAKLGPADRARLEEYLESVREIERRTRIIASTDISSMKIPERPVGVNDNFDEQVDLISI